MVGETVLFAKIGGFKTGLGLLVPPPSFRARCDGFSSVVVSGFAVAVLVRFQPGSGIAAEN